MSPTLPVDLSEVPIIDVGPVCLGGEIPQELVDKVSSACRKWGFFQAVNHGVPKQVVDAFDREQRRFFAREMGYKRAVKRTETNSRWARHANIL